MIKNLCVFCGSSIVKDNVYTTHAAKLAEYPRDREIKLQNVSSVL
ncbi:MAG: hypothetical protein NT004_07225 [Bacteroidetes bacterium]|nr:hypothetical protein [Bacteroidota bacterium]